MLPFLVIIPFCVATKMVGNRMIFIAVFMNVHKYAGKIQEKVKRLLMHRGMLRWHHIRCVVDRVREYGTVIKIRSG